MVLLCRLIPCRNWLSSRCQDDTLTLMANGIGQVSNNQGKARIMRVYSNCPVMSTISAKGGASAWKGSHVAALHNWRYTSLFL
jgi:hypothetical protein